MYSKIHFVLYSLNSICVASVKPRTSQTSTFVSLYKPGHCILDVVLLNVQRSLLCSPTESHSSSLGAQPILIVTLGTAFLPQEFRSFSGSHRINQSARPIKQINAQAAEAQLCGCTSLFWAPQLHVLTKSNRLLPCCIHAKYSEAFVAASATLRLVSMSSQMPCSQKQ